MKSKIVFKDSAEIAKVVELSVGDSYKRLKKEYSDSYKSVYGVITDIVNNGEVVMVSTLEVEADWSSVSVSAQTFSDDSDLVLFQVTEEEIDVIMQKMVRNAENDITSAEGRLEKARANLRTIEKIAEQSKKGAITIEQAAQDSSGVIEA